MRVAQKIAGYSLAEADLLRKAMGKKARELIAIERQQVHRRRRAHRLRRCPRHPAVRHHRAVRRLRVQQEPRLRVRPRRLPDGLPQGALPGRVLRLPAHERQGHAGEGGRLHRRVPGDGHPRAHPRHQPLGHRLRRPVAGARCPTASTLPIGSPGRHHVRAVGGAQRRRGPRRPAAEERDANGPFASFHDFAERVPEPVLNKRAVESLIKAGAFDSLGHTRKGLLGVFEHITDTTLDPPPRARAGRDEPVRRLGRRGRGGADEARLRRARCRSPSMEFDKTDKLRHEKEMLGLYVSDHPLFGVEAALRRKVEQSIGELDELGDGAHGEHRRRGHRADPQVHQEGRPDGRRSCSRTSRRASR